MTAYHIIIRGRVQGVFFRRYAKECAAELGLTGFVQNMPDGSVYCHAEGEEDGLQHFIDWCSTGSPQSQVKGVEAERVPLVGYDGFGIQK